MSKKIKGTSPLLEMAKLGGINPMKNNQNQLGEANSDLVVEVDPNLGTNWKNPDRPSNELGKLQALANEFKNPKIGQQQPCIVRKINNDSKFTFEVIAGERRWRAAKLANVKLKVIFKELDDNEAELCQVSENLNRENLSDYALGMNFGRLVNSKLTTQKSLCDFYEISPKHMTRLLAFPQISQDVWDAVGDMRKVTARTASEIRAIIKKDPSTKNIIISLAPKLRDGKLGSTTLLREIAKIKSTNNKQKIDNTTKVINHDGLNLFKWKNKSDGTIAINLFSNIAKQVNFEELMQCVKDEISRQVNK